MWHPTTAVSPVMSMRLVPARGEDIDPGLRPRRESRFRRPQERDESRRLKAELIVPPLSSSAHGERHSVSEQMSQL